MHQKTVGDSQMAIGELPAAYRLHAAHCTEIAARTADRNRLTLLSMARAWLLLAEQADKNNETIVCGMPGPTKEA
jgi:hypothetical protein